MLDDEHAERKVQAQRWRRSSAPHVIRLECRSMQGGRRRWDDRDKHRGRRKIDRRNARSRAARNPMAGCVNTFVRRRRRCMPFDHAEIVVRRRFVRVMMRVFTHAGQGSRRRRHEAMVAATEHPVREHVESGQYHDEWLHGFESFENQQSGQTAA